jgi:hypothetical protein
LGLDVIAGAPASLSGTTEAVQLAVGALRG